MSYSGDAAEQVVRMSLEGVEIAAKLTGAGAKELAVLLYAVLRDQRKTAGKVRLTNMLRSGKELKVFAVKDSDLQKFCLEAKKYGVLYCVLKDRDATDGITDVMVRAEDAAKINRIFERFELSTVEKSTVKKEPEKEDRFLDALFSQPNPNQARTENVILSGPISEPRGRSGESSSERRPSVRKELKAIREAQKQTATKIKPTREMER